MWNGRGGGTVSHEIGRSGAKRCVRVDLDPYQLTVFGGTTSSDGVTYRYWQLLRPSPARTTVVFRFCAVRPVWLCFILFSCFFFKVVYFHP